MPPNPFAGDVTELSFEAPRGQTRVRAGSERGQTLVVRLARLGAAHGGTIVAAAVENDEPIARDRPLTSATARLTSTRMPRDTAGRE